jgi:hypothetical protein
MLLDPNISVNEISDEALISEFHKPTKYTKRSLYGVMANRASNNDKIKNLLFELIISEEARYETEMGFIMHAWLPAIFILQESNDAVKLELKHLLKNWTQEEKELFLFYIKRDQEYYCLLYDI